MGLPREIDFAGFRYTRPGHLLHGVPLDAVAKIGALSGIRWYADDFTEYTGPNTAGEAGGWVLTETAAGSGNAQRVDIDDSAEGGWLKLLTDDGDNDLENLQRVGEPWRFVLGRKLWCAIRVKVSDADDGEALFGLAITDTSLIASLPSDGLFFEKAETATKMDFHARKDGVSVELTSIDPSDMADGVAKTYGFLIERNGEVKVYVDDVLAGTIAAGNTLPDDEDLTLSLSIQTGTTAAKSLAVDWVLVATEV